MFRAMHIGGDRVCLAIVLLFQCFSHTASTDCRTHHSHINSATGKSADSSNRGNAVRFAPALRLRGGTLAQELEEELARRRARGQTFEELTPDQYRAQGLDGASYDQFGNLQFGPPDVDMTPEEMLQACDEACTELCNMSEEEYRAIIEEGLNTVWRPLVDDPADKIIEHGGFAKHPEKLEPAKALLQKSAEWLTMMGYFKDPRTGNWHAPQTQGEKAREAEMRQQWESHQAQQEPQPALAPQGMLQPPPDVPPSSSPVQPAPPQYAPPGQYFAPGQLPPGPPSEGQYFAPGPPS